MQQVVHDAGLQKWTLLCLQSAGGMVDYSRENRCKLPGELCPQNASCVSTMKRRFST